MKDMGCFQFLVIMHEVSINTCKFCVHIRSFHVVDTLELLGCMTSLYLTL